MPELNDRLIEWTGQVFGEKTAASIDQTKCRFITLQMTRNYWAMFANPKIYDIEAALDHLIDETWMVKKSDVQNGDRLLLWRGLKQGNRGAVGLAEVVSDPAVMHESEAASRFYVGDAPIKPELRVWIRMFRPRNSPLWLEDDTTGVLESLSVARAHGGTVFKIEAEQWHRVVALLGGWEPLEYETQSGRIPEGTRSSSGQGFRVSAEERKAIEDHAMSLAEEHFREQGYDVEDVSARKSFDLCCTRGVEELRVEVKGTQTNGAEVLLTPNEVAHAQKHRDQVALFIVHSVQVNSDGERHTASGGETRVILPWNIDEGELKPTGYKYRVPG